MQYRAPRHVSQKPLIVVTPRGEFDAQVFNVSRTGLALQGMPPLPSGTRIVLRLLNCRIPGQLIWYRQATAGVQFTHAMSASDLRVFGAMGRAPSADPPVRQKPLVLGSPRIHP